MRIKNIFAKRFIQFYITLEIQETDLKQTMINSIASQSYNIEIGPHQESSLNDLISNKYLNAKKVILVDENTHEHCVESLLTTYPALTDAEIMLLPCGEENKVMEVCFQVWEALSEYKIGRNDLIINLGGGVVTDMGGFIASIFKRGLGFVNIPTSLLAMVDASSGGKTGIDLGNYKNQLGLFAYPEVVIIDVNFLNSLPEEEKLWGKAEMLKHGLIQSKSHWDKIKMKSPQDIDESDVLDSVSIKNEIVLSDPTEKGNRKKLNFGHTIGHALEGLNLHVNKIAHGHAVAIGMLAEAHVSNQLNLLSSEELTEITEIILHQYDKIELSEEEIPALLDLMGNDKKNSNNQINLTLLNGIGKSSVNHTPEVSVIENALKFLISI